MISTIKKLYASKILKISLLIVTLLAFMWYFESNRSEFERLKELDFFQLITIMLGQILSYMGNALIIVAIGQFFQKHINFIEANRINAQSSFVNFFGFLQGGFGVRGAYLKVKHKITVKNYLKASFIQYLLFFSFSGAIILFGLFSLGNPLARFIILTLFVSILVSVFLIRYVKILTTKAKHYLQTYAPILKLKPLTTLCSGIALYLLGGLIAYSVELAAIGANPTLGGTLIYTGLTQFSILIAITPGGLGIREAILIVAQNQMQLTTSDIVVASTIDRAVNFLTLGLVLFVTYVINRSTSPTRNP